MDILTQSEDAEKRVLPEMADPTKSSNLRQKIIFRNWGHLAVLAFFGCTLYFLLTGQFLVYNDQIREWTSAYSVWNMANPVFPASSALGAAPLTYQIFLLPWTLLGVEPGLCYGVSSFVVAVLGYFVLYAKSRKLGLVYAISVFGAGFFWSAYGSITASFAAYLSFLAWGLVLASSMRPALWIGALAGATYFSALPTTAAIGFLYLLRTQGKRRLWEFGTAMLMPLVPYVLVAKSFSVSSGMLKHEGTVLDAILFLGGGWVITTVSLLLMAYLSRRNKGSSVTIVVVLGHWLVAAVGLSFKTDWWSGYYTWQYVPILCLVILYYLPLRKDVLAAIVAAGLFVASHMIYSYPVHSTGSMFGPIPHMRIRWDLAERILLDQKTYRVEGDLASSMRWAREYRNAGLPDKRQLLSLWFKGDLPFCEEDICRIAPVEAAGPDEITGYSGYNWFQFTTNTIRLKGEIRYSGCSVHKERVIPLDTVPVIRSGLLSNAFVEIEIAEVCQDVKVSLNQGDWLHVFRQNGRYLFREGEGTLGYMAPLF